MTDKFILAFLLDKKKSGHKLTISVGRDYTSVKDSLSPLQVGDRKDRVAEEIFFCQCFAFIVTKPCKQASELYNKILKLKVNIFSGCHINSKHTLKFSWGVFPFQKHWSGYSFCSFLWKERNG